MASGALANPGVIINGDKYRIVTNSLTYDGGEGEITVRTASGGGDDIETIHTVNAESKKSKVMFELFPTNDNDKSVGIWKKNIAQNVIEFTEVIIGGDMVRTFPGMSLINAVERGAGSDGTMSLEWEGDPMVSV